jgi:hypothetical protein
VRLLYGAGRSGPCRAIQAGSGYWSQDAASQVLGWAATPVGLWVRWPGGREQTVAFTNDNWDVYLQSD